ncbi:MAG: hypothetical protein JXA69_01355 [Phycisphaerae bacterium]|nr:hypothetical protein [Phycisphaerae bacterium]
MSHSPPPDRTAFRRPEWQLISRCRTPRQTQQFLRAIPYNAEANGPTLRTFRGVVEHGCAHCFEAALTAAVILEQHGYPPLLLDLTSADKLDHVVFLFERNGRFGTVGKSRFPGLLGRKPVFPSVQALVEDYIEPFVDYTGRIISYAVFDLRTVHGINWRLSERNLWALERILIARRHIRVATCNRRHRQYVERYRAYKRRYPGREPAYFANKQRWL